MVAGENAGALPAFAPALSDAAGGGEGLFRMAMYGINVRSAAYRWYGSGGDLPCRGL